MVQEKTPSELSLLVYRDRGDSGSCITETSSPACTKLPVQLEDSPTRDVSFSVLVRCFTGLERSRMILVNVLNVPSLVIVSSPRRRAC